MSFVDLYEVLGVPKSASAEEIKSAFRKKAKECHPDVGGKEADFIKIKEAYDVLSYSKTRNEYNYVYNQYKSKKSDNMNNHQHKEKEPRKKEKQNKNFAEQSKQETKPEEPAQKESKKKKAAFNSDWWKTLRVICGAALLVFIGIQLSNYLANYSLPIKTFTVGSPKDEVKTVMGEPDTIEKSPYSGDVWRYGLSAVKFDAGGRVYGWSFMKKGKATVGDIKSDEATFTLNSTKQEVIDAMGTPESLDIDVWRYGALSTVTFDKDKVSRWSSVKNGKAFMGEKKPDALPIKEGSTKQEVVNFLGTPESIDNTYYTRLSHEVWSYELASVSFDTSGKVKDWVNLQNKR